MNDRLEMNYVPFRSSDSNSGELHGIYGGQRRCVDVDGGCCSCQRRNALQSDRFSFSRYLEMLLPWTRDPRALIGV